MRFERAILGYGRRQGRETRRYPITGANPLRTAIVATYYFIRQHDLEDTFRIGEILVDDPDELVQKAVGGWVREAGKQDLDRLRAYLDRFAATMPRTTLRYAVEHLDAAERRRYLEMKSESAGVARGA